MTLTDKTIYFDKDFHFELIASTAKKFIIFSLKKSDYQSIYKHGNNHAFETFLLIKAQPDCPIDKSIVFTREKIQTNIKQKRVSQANYLESESYFCSFLRHVDLLYCKKLNQTLDILNIHSQIPIENQWFLLYEVHSYKPVIENLISFELKPPIYGQRVLITNQFNSKNYKILSTISNLFRLSSQNIYFVNDCLEPHNIKDFNLVISSDQTYAFGLTLKIKDEILLIPLNMILFEKPSQTIIDKNLSSKLQKTCYVEFLGSYCTGIVVEEDKIITARHLFPKHQQKIGNKVIVKLFPYQQNIVGYVTKIGIGNLDIMEIQLFTKQTDLKLKSNQKLKHKQFVKQQLIGNLVEQKQCLNSRLKLRVNFMKSLFKKQKIVPKKKYLLGDQITAVGFGKLPFHVSVLNKFDMVFPTVAVGVISKVISIGKIDTFMKTDAQLYSGFSGCGIWKQDMVGMAVFILKNKTTNSHHNRHNFSYTAEFIEQLRKTQTPQMIVEINEKIQEFNQIQTRHQLNLVNLPHPKL